LVTASQVQLGPFRPSADVRYADVDGLIVMLDLRSETYKVLDDVASRLWSVVTGDVDQGSEFQALTEQYDIDQANLTAELMAFVQSCFAGGLLEAPSAGEPRPAAVRRLPLRTGLLGALSCLIITRAMLKRLGLRETYARYAGIATSRVACSIQAAVTSFVRAENFFVVRRAPDDCLLRSLAFYRFLRSAGLPAEHVIGVRRVPFQAHAWVECGGVPVLDDRPPPFRCIARIGGPSPGQPQTAAQ
jgi:hypothetical protein